MSGGYEFTLVIEDVDGGNSPCLKSPEGIEGIIQADFRINRMRFNKER